MKVELECGFADPQDVHQECELLSVRELSEFFSLPASVVIRLLKGRPIDAWVGGVPTYALAHVFHLLLLMTDKELRAKLCPNKTMSDFYEMLDAAGVTPIYGSAGNPSPLPRWNGQDMSLLEDVIQRERQNQSMQNMVSPQILQRIEWMVKTGKYPPSPTFLMKRCKIHPHQAGEILRRVGMGLHLI